MQPEAISHTSAWALTLSWSGLHHIIARGMQLFLAYVTFFLLCEYFCNNSSFKIRMDQSFIHSTVPCVLFAEQIHAFRDMVLQNSLTVGGVGHIWPFLLYVYGLAL